MNLRAKLSGPASNMEQTGDVHLPPQVMLFLQVKECMLVNWSAPLQRYREAGFAENEILFQSFWIRTSVSKKHKHMSQTIQKKKL